MTLSRPQINALRYARGRQLYAADINEGNGNMRRTLLSLLKLGMLAWDPICTGRVVVTAAGERELQKTGGRKLFERRLSRAPHWNGLCPAGKHGLDFEGQRCDLCASTTEAQP